VGKEFCTLEDLVILNSFAWLFDLDGTLVDSATQIGVSINYARREFGFHDLSPSAIEELVGLPITYFLRDIELSKTEEQELILRFREVLEVEILLKNQVFPGVKEFLIKLRNREYRLGIATSKPTYLAEMVIKNSSLNNLFNVIQGTENFPPKPDPTCIQKAMEILKTKDAIMVGDRTEDIQAANAAGISSIGIAHSFHNKQALEEAGAMHAFDSFLEFTDSVELARLLID
jgi:phosphoglycolate phosphatase